MSEVIRVADQAQRMPEQGRIARDHWLAEALFQGLHHHAGAQRRAGDEQQIGARVAMREAGF